MKQVVIKPVITEKSMRLAGAGTYMFDVSSYANKVTVAEAVKAQFKVDPTEVRTTILKGKVKQLKGIKGTRKDKKRAYVTVKKGQTISAFDSEPEKKEKK